MSAEAKIHLSKFEMELVNNSEWVLTKQSIIKKVGLLFGEVLHSFKRISTEEKLAVPGIDFSKNGKISKGENFNGLPYVMLDYPASFSKEEIFAVRSMFWWGNFFSVTLHISGYRLLNSLSIADLLIKLRGSDFFICISDDEWQHTFEASNYVSVNEIKTDQYEEIFSKPFFKISKKIGLDKWADAEDFFEKSYREIMGLLER